MGKIDFAGLKLKVVASIIAIAAVDLLETFVEIDTIDKSDVFWSIAILLSFVVAGVLLALDGPADGGKAFGEERHDADDGRRAPSSRC